LRLVDSRTFLKRGDGIENIHVIDIRCLVIIIGMRLEIDLVSNTSVRHQEGRPF